MKKHKELWSSKDSRGSFQVDATSFNNINKFSSAGKDADVNNTFGGGTTNDDNGQGSAVEATLSWS